MFSKTKRKIVFAVVFSLLALLAVTLTTIYLSNRFAINAENLRTLRTYAQRYSLAGQQPKPADNERPDGRPGNREDKNEPRFQLSTFYSVAFSEEGEVLAVNNGNSALRSEDELIRQASALIKGGKKSGRKGDLTYLVEDKGEYTLVAMLDSTISEGNQTVLIRQMLIIGAAAMAVLAVAAIFIARRIVKPLEENDKRQKQFVPDAGHELKTPIAVISANSELLRREAGDSEWLDNIDYENERMSDLVKQLLFLSKAESGGLPKETVDLSRLVDGEVLPFESLAFEKGVRIESRIERGATVDGNPNQLRQLVSILLDNALSHGTGDTIELTLRREKHTALLTVQNRADPIGAEQLERLFDRFYRSDAARSGNGSHYGLGLSIAKAVTELHGGTIRAEYKNGTAIFTAAIPEKKI